MKIPSIPHKKPRRGFALVVTMSLMALLLVLSVGLLSLSSVSLRTSAAGNADRIAQANARLGLLMAIGELQKYVGKDQRITATADIAGDATGERLGDGTNPPQQTANSLNGISKGLSAIQPGTRRWTGVWENSLLESGTGGDPSTKIFTETPSPVLVQWLVSGNEGGSSPKFTPAREEMGVGSDGRASEPDEAVVLVGEHSVGSPDSDSLPNYVVAPLVTIKGENANGKYAWWVGDEGVKARLNTNGSYQSGDLATSANMSAQRRAWETVDGFDQYPMPGADTDLKGLVTLGQGNLLIKSSGGSSATPIEKAYHAATTDSMGVLSDTLNGGLRLDLSTMLQNLPSSPVAGVANSPASGAPIIPRGFDFSPIQGPTWNRLEDFAELSEKASGGSLNVEKLPGGAVIAPVITDLRIVLGANIRSQSGTFYVDATGKIAITILNPYPYALRWSAPLKIRFSNPDTFRGTQYRTTSIQGATTDARYPRYIGGSTTDPAVMTNTIFEIPAGSLPAGEAVCYTNGSRVNKRDISTTLATAPLQKATNNNIIELGSSVFLQNTSRPVSGNDPINLVVLEEQNTAPLDLQMTIGSTNTVLRNINRLELDNAYALDTNRSYDVRIPKSVLTGPSAANIIDKPFPLMAYCFTLSQPGFPEMTNFVEPGYFGVRGSTLRTFADFNLQAVNYRKSIASYNPPPFFLNIPSRTRYPTPRPPTPVAAGRSSYQPPLDFSADISEPKWGRTIKSAGQNKTVLFGIPETLSSLAQFQHADLTGDDQYASVASQPGNAVGNSYATPFVRRMQTMTARQDFRLVSDTSAAVGTAADYFDISYLLNAALWDTYFLSTISQSGQPLNRQMVDINPEASPTVLQDGRTAATRLMVEGAFNVNSTEKDAWKALLGGSKYLRHQADGSGQNSGAFFPRSLEQPNGSLQQPTGSLDDSFSGYRRLTDDQLDTLAEEITKQVRLRGPFVSLSHFINRGIAPINPHRELTRSGALQSAIDNSGTSGGVAININPASTVSGFSEIRSTAALAEDRVQLRNATAAVGMADFPGGRGNSVSGLYPRTSEELNPATIASILADLEMMNNPTYRSEQGSRSTGIPGWLTQADVLQVIGPAITARSDTFKVRAYGEATDAQGKVIAKAWCEAIVQRTPSYVDPSDNDTERDTATSKQLSAINEKFGRQMKMVSFRWLSPYEI